jgi:prepilin signal peptidase PulO-like enzyme (type II secretory pathway)
MTPQLILEYLFAAPEGGVMGSFIGVVVSRIPPLMLSADANRVGGLKLILSVLPTSHCRECNSPVHMWNMIPVLSYVLLRGRCRDCSAAIGLECALLELLGAAIGLVSVALFGWSGHAMRFYVSLRCLRLWRLSSPSWR